MHIRSMSCRRVASITKGSLGLSRVSHGFVSERKPYFRQDPDATPFYAPTYSVIHAQPTTYQWYQIGLFLKVPCKNFSYKCGPNIWLLLGYFEKCHFLRRNNCGYFWAPFGNNFHQFPNSPSGHTAIYLYSVENEHQIKGCFVSF